MVCLSWFDFFKQQEAWQSRFEHDGLAPLMNVCGWYTNLTGHSDCEPDAEGQFWECLTLISAATKAKELSKLSILLFRHQGSDCWLNLSFSSTGPHLCRGNKGLHGKEGCLSSVNGVFVCVTGVWECSSKHDEWEVFRPAAVHHSSVQADGDWDQTESVQ